MLGKSDAAIRMWETGKSKPDADTLVKLSFYFDCSVDYLLGLSDYRNDVTQREIESTVLDTYKPLLNFMERKNFLASLKHFLDSLGEIGCTRTRDDAILLIGALLTNCGNQALLCQEIRCSTKTEHDAYFAFLRLYEECGPLLMGYRDSLTGAAKSANRKLTPFGKWMDGIKDLANKEQGGD